MNKGLIYFILSAYIMGILLLVYMQFNSSKNIDNLIAGNQLLSTEFQINKHLAVVERETGIVQRNVKKLVSTGDTSFISRLNPEIDKIKISEAALQKISDDDSTAKYVDLLNDEIDKKIALCERIIDTFRIHGKPAADKYMGSEIEFLVSTGIERTVNKIDSTRKRHLMDSLDKTDASGRKAKLINNILILFVLISSAVFFWYLVNMIQKLILSEKKVKDAAQVKENFMANMSHEIRTPMNAILGFTHLLQRKKLDNESAEYVKTIQNSGENLLTIINDILDLSKIEAGMMRIESAPFSIRGLIHSVEAMLREKANEKQIRLSDSVDETMPDTLEGDATRLTQILVNLIGNAIKFTPRGSIGIKIINEGVEGSIVKTGIVISDTGIGIEPEKIKIIFDRFKQADDAITRKFGGTGLGLSIVKDLVILQNGTVSANSEPGKGTSIHISIPYKISSAEISADAIRETEDAGILFENECILVVEDNEINRSLVKHLFNNWKLPFDMAHNGQQAIELLKANPDKYSLVLMDIQMPEMDGYTTSELIRYELKYDIPIIAMTAHALAGEREKCIAKGMNEYISKPIRVEQLYKMIRMFSRKKFPVKEQPSQGTAPENGYRYINLQYMREISGGDVAYEKTVTEQFMELMPEELIAIEKAYETNNISHLQKLVHNMKTTVSIMGLTAMLEPDLDAIEHEGLSKEALLQIIQRIKAICEASVKEARLFYTTLT